MKTVISIAFATVILAGCTASGNSTAALDVSAIEAPPVPAGSVGATATDPAADEGAPKVMAAGTSPIKPEIQTAFCQDQVAFVYSAEPQFVTAQGRVVAPDGSTTIDVTINDAAGGAKTYICRLDAENRFVDVMPTSAGLL